MEVYYNGKEIGNILTNRSLTLNEILYALGYDINKQSDLERAYNDGFEPIYLDDCGIYQVDEENIIIGD